MNLLYKGARFELLYRNRYLAIVVLSIWLISPASAQSWPKVPDVDLSKLRPEDFNEEELDVPYYLKHFHTVANSVLESGPDKGFISAVVWRRLHDNKPYNARIMENMLSLAYFYSTERPWNPYFKSDAVRIRLEAALEFWMGKQHESGRFSEYGVEKWNLAGTSFATLCMGRALEFLYKTGGINNDVLSRAKSAQRKAIMIILKDPDFYEHGKSYSNQYTAGLAGALAYLDMFPDPELDKLFHERFSQAQKDFQSIAGFFYEAGGTDHGYNLNTHHSNMRIMYDYARNTPLQKNLVKEESKYVDWITLNSVIEPSGNYFTLNRGTETRTPAPVITNYFLKSPLGESVEMLRAFTPSKEDIVERYKKKRELLVRNWPDVGNLETYSPTNLLHLDRYQWYPTKVQQLKARKQLPYLIKDDFIHQRTDEKQPVTFTFVRKKGYYAVLNTGKIIGNRQRYGIGLIWGPEAGTFLQSQAATNNAAWGTKGDSAKVYEAFDVYPEMEIDGKPVVAKPGNTDLPSGILSARYTLGNKGSKKIGFYEKEVKVDVNHEGTFKEYIPLLLNAGELVDVSKPGKAMIKKNGQDVSIIYSSGQVSLEKTNMTSGDQVVTTMIISSRDQLSYSIVIGFK